MRTIQMTLDEELIKNVDYLISQLGKTRSEFAREALREAIKRYETSIKEEQHKKGYLEKPTQEPDILEWENEQEWGN